MKSFLTILTFIVLFNGCADKNAFSKFGMSEAQERSASSLQSSKIKTQGKIEGLFSAVYLNEVYPKIYSNNEYFFIYLYLKNKKEMYDPNKLEDIKLTLKLNSKLPVKIKQLPHDSQFSDLVSTKNGWNRYYLVAFKKESSKKLSIVLENGQFSSDSLIYQKDKQ
jgi:hypothetical protein